MTRTLQNRLALANVKIKNGWESLSIDAIEPVIDVELKRKRPGSSNEAMSDASSTSERFYRPGVLDSSPLAAPIFSDDIRRSGTRSVSSGSTIHNKRPRYDKPVTQYPASSTHHRGKVIRSTTTASSSWKNSFQLPESSPAYALAAPTCPASPLSQRRRPFPMSLDLPFCLRKMTKTFPSPRSR
jgi:hypothetical protein